MDGDENSVSCGNSGAGSESVHISVVPFLWCVVSKEVASGESAKFAVLFLPIEFLAQKM